MKLLLNKYVLVVLVIMSLGAYIGHQELRYSKALLTHQETSNALSATSQELTDLLEDNRQILSKLRLAEKAVKDYQDVVRKLDSELGSLNEQLDSLAKEDQSVQEVFDIKLPDSVLNILRE